MSENEGRAGAAAATGPRKQRLLLHVGLFLGTFLTTTATGALHAHGSWTPSLSDIAPISSLRSMRCGLPADTLSPVWRSSLNPVRVQAMSYVPGGKFRNAYSPWASLTSSSLADVPVLVSVTVTPGRAPPC